MQVPQQKYVMMQQPTQTPQPQYVVLQNQNQATAPHPAWNVAEKAYEGSATLGKIVGIFGAATGIFIGLLCIGISLYMILKKNTRNIIDAIIKKADCKEITLEKDKGRQITQNCVLDISYTAIDGKTYEAKLTTDGKKYIEGQTIKVSYDITNPADVATHTVSTRTVGWIIFGIGLLIFGGSSFSLYLTLNYKMYQAAQGVGVVANVIDNAMD